MNVPLRYDTSSDIINIRQMTDANLERLVYYTQVAYATQLNSSGNGYIFTGSGATAIGSHQDTLSDQQINQTASPNNAPGTSQYPATYPGITEVNGTLYAYQQDRTFPAFPNESTLNANSYLCLDGSYDIKVAKDESDIIAGVINTALTNLKSEDEVGSYRVATSTPTDGGAGTWTDMGTWFIDKYYNNTGNVTYKLYLKRSLTTVPGSDIIPLKLFNNDFREHSSITDTSDLVQNVLLPTMTRRLSTGTSLCYEVVDVAPTGDQLRGTVTNKRFNQASNTQDIIGSGASEVYRKISTPNTGGTTTTVSTKYLKYLG
jgi:hypothetical protein